MKRATAPSYDLFKLAVTVVLIVILVLMLLRGCATPSAAPAATEKPAVIAPSASDTPSAVPTETEVAPASNTPETLAPSSTPTIELTATPVSDESTPTSTPTESSTTETAKSATPTLATEQAASCNTSVPSRLSVGDTAQVVQRLNMRSEASITAPILQTNPTNTQVEIIGGPVCTPVGDRAYLEALGRKRGFAYREVAFVESGGGKLSSTRLRQEIAEGRMERAADIMGRPYALEGTVGSGAGRGTELGFPTANLQVDPRVALPAAGVYAGAFHLPDGTQQPCATSVGSNPTFGGSELRVEAHLLDWHGDLYGISGAVDFRHRLRDEERFEGADALVAQMRADVAEAARRLTGEGR